jgi:transposase InsO family protein
MDVYSRKIIGWQVYEEENSALAADLMMNIGQQENIKRGQLTLYSGNGSPMKGATLLATLQDLGVIPCLRRPSVSSDHLYCESLFGTLKYRPDYPDKPLNNLQSARVWEQNFVEWYNHKHRHGGIKLLTPAQRHAGEDIQMLADRHPVYLEAKSANPSRWSGEARNWNPNQGILWNRET